MEDTEWNKKDKEFKSLKQELKEGDIISFLIMLDSDGKEGYLSIDG
jgi:hypothetical protein